LSASPVPLNSLADASGVPVLGYLIDIGAAVSFFACVTGSLNAAGRLLYSMGQSRLLHRSIGTAHPRRQTPHLAILTLSVICAVIAIVLTLSGIGIMNVSVPVLTHRVRARPPTTTPPNRLVIRGFRCRQAFGGDGRTASTAGTVDQAVQSDQATTEQCEADGQRRRRERNSAIPQAVRIQKGIGIPLPRPEWQQSTP
jgi:hypothetical protein